VRALRAMIGSTLEYEGIIFSSTVLFFCERSLVLLFDAQFFLLPRSEQLLPCKFGSSSILEVLLLVSKHFYTRSRKIFLFERGMQVFSS
jgi:hypothetical protein